jgi:PAS domain S-box-containing protein
MKDFTKILFVEDVRTDAELIWRELEKHGIVFNKLLVDNKKDFMAGLKSFAPDLIVSDYSLPQFNGMQALILRNEYTPLIPFIIVTGSINETVAVECMKAGADDYILKDNLSRLGLSVVNAMNKAKVHREKIIIEEALLKSEEIFSHFMEHSPIYVFFKDENLRAIRLSRNFEEMLGKPVTELLGKNMDELFPSELAKSMIADDKKILLEGRSITVEEELNGRYYTTIKFPIVIEGNQPFLAGYTIDITDRRQASEAIRKSEEKYRSIFENVQDIYYESSIAGTILEVSPSISTLSHGQYQRKDLIGKPLSEFYSFQGEREMLLDAIKSKGSINDFEIKLRNRDGSLIPCSVSSKVCFDSEGRPEKIVGSMRDISIRKTNEEELTKAKIKAEESDRLKTAFLHNISHEIRTPMNAIVGFSALLGEQNLDAASQQTYIETIMDSSNHLLEIISDIIDISNLEANLVKILKNEVNVNHLIQTLFNQFLPLAQKKHINLNSQSFLSNSEANIQTDSTKLTQIISNLINNAIKFTDEGSVDILCKKTLPFLEISVTDTGIGIPAKFHEKVFDRFFQVQNIISKIYEGTGLGLSISKEYVELMGGKIWLSSEPGKGTTFNFTIPYEKQTKNDQFQKIESKTESFRFMERKKILIAEDIDSNYKLLTYFLKETNAEIIRAENGKEAVAKCLEDRDIDLVLMDIKMPVMDGYTAVRLIREANISIPIIAQTAYLEDKSKAFDCGCTGFILKPFDKNKLLKVLADFI